jgi:hypothetical protein
MKGREGEREGEKDRQIYREREINIVGVEGLE